jgi:hypothetical protein
VKTLGLQKLENVAKSAFSTNEKPTDYKHVTSYNNYYEFGTEKEEPARYAKALKVRPWSVVVEGEVAKPRTFGIEELLKFPLEERIYRLRCVEAWSMVVPWVGFEFNRIAKLVEPTAKAKFVEFVTAYQPETMVGAKLPVLDWPYLEGLRIDEAMHPLTIMGVGLYGEVLPNQNGAPIRSSSVEVRIQERQVARQDPFRRKAAPDELGAGAATGVRLLLQREPERRPPALDAEEGAPHPRLLRQSPDGALQRLRRPGGEPLRRDGPHEALLSP